MSRLGSTSVCVLMSGGIDSSACAHFYKNLGRRPVGLHIDYGQPAARAEKRSASALAKHFGMQLSVIRCRGLARSTTELVPNRNAFLLSLAAVQFGARGGLLVIGVHSGTIFADCSTAFLKAYGAVLDLTSDGLLQVAAPFARWTKQDVVSYARKAEIPLSLTYSCQSGRNQPCGTCLSCRDRRSLNV